MLQVMKKSDLIRAAGSGYRLAQILGISPQAVNKWPGDTVPPLQQYRIRELKPRWWRKGGPLSCTQSVGEQAESAKAA